MHTRPRTVTAAYWIWIVCATILVLFGLLAATASADAIRERLADQAVSHDDVDAVMRLLRVSGVISLLVGLAIGLLAGPVRAGDERFRRALVALSAVFALIQIGAVLFGLSPGFLLIVPILLLSAGILAYRPPSNAWFARGE